MVLERTMDAVFELCFIENLLVVFVIVKCIGDAGSCVDGFAGHHGTVNQPVDAVAVHRFIYDQNTGREVYDKTILDCQAGVVYFCFDVVEDRHELIFGMIVHQHDVSIADDTGKCFPILHIFM